MLDMGRVTRYCFIGFDYLAEPLGLMFWASTLIRQPFAQAFSSRCTIPVAATPLRYIQPYKHI